MLELLKSMPRQYNETNVETDPIDDIAGVYKQKGAGGTVSLSTRIGPAPMCNRIKRLSRDRKACKPRHGGAHAPLTVGRTEKTYGSGC